MTNKPLQKFFDIATRQVIELEAERAHLRAQVAELQSQNARLRAALEAFVSAHDNEIKELAQDAGMNHWSECDCDLCNEARAAIAPDCQRQAALKEDGDD